MFLPTGSTRCASGAFQVEVKVVLPHALRHNVATQIIARHIRIKSCSPSFHGHYRGCRANGKRRNQKVSTCSTSSTSHEPGPLSLRVIDVVMYTPSLRTAFTRYPRRCTT